MNADTGQIFPILPDNKSLFEAFKAAVPEAKMPIHGFVELGNMPVEGCPNCKGTGIFRITDHGKRIPCKCTNPQ